MNKKLFQKAWQAVEEDSTVYELAAIGEMCRSSEALMRLNTLLTMRKQISQGQSPEVFFDLARPLILDEDNDCRWQALIVIGELVDTQPELVWQVIQEHGQSADEDMRTGVATVLLEHLLEHHFDPYFQKLKQDIENGSHLLADTLSRCWAFGDAEFHWSEVRTLKEEAKKQTAVGK